MMTREQEAALQAVHAELLELLRDAVRVLEQEKLPYSLICGTLLGAVRHGGFIPWDDDIDIVLPRESYERFAALYPAEAAPGFGLDLTDTWVPRVRRAGGGKNAFLDLFILDPLPAGKAAQGWKLFRLKALQGMLKEHTDYSRFSFSRRVLLRATAALGKPFSKEAKLRAYDRIARQGDSANPVVHMANGAFKLLSMPFLQQDFLTENLKEIPFEGLAARAPQNATALLVQLYGPDYMTPPPEDQRVPLHLDL